ncbi:hypothetical protein ONZ45_g12062 [Pleurotus djamor]|nr:hypothetical protein ONZ45_g12062 [Pleurotus djamor]
MYNSTCPKKQEARAAELQREMADLQKRLGDGVDAEEIVKRHIRLLHDYNEAKDAAQILIGRLANMRETTVRQIHEEMGLETTD